MKEPATKSYVRRHAPTIHLGLRWSQRTPTATRVGRTTKSLRYSKMARTSRLATAGGVRADAQTSNSCPRWRLVLVKTTQFNLLSVGFLSGKCVCAHSPPRCCHVCRSRVAEEMDECWRGSRLFYSFEEAGPKTFFEVFHRTQEANEYTSAAPKSN